MYNFFKYFVTTEKHLSKNNFDNNLRFLRCQLMTKSFQIRHKLYILNSVAIILNHSDYNSIQEIVLYLQKVLPNLPFVNYYKFKRSLKTVAVWLF